MTKISFEELPTKVEQLLNEVNELKEIILKGITATKEYPRYLSIEDTISWLADQGLTISKSTLYKYTSKRLIPFVTFNGRIVFESKELKTWCLSQQNKRYNNK